MHVAADARATATLQFLDGQRRQRVLPLNKGPKKVLPKSEAGWSLGRMLMRMRRSVGRSVGLDSRSEHHYWCNMVIESIREFNRAVPFVPYELHMNGGETYTVPHPDFISIAPRGSFVVIIDQHDRPHHLSAILIERVSPLNGHARRRIRKRRL